ncbi:MAG TPA: type II toxin-antitoxin system prevent-host-death family antitoxin [Spirochaetota bacterium]|nr:type II toxin-antitoxin system prevent-host-death family antitoxin [Spirochaetota bacterium]HQO21866.1 type II toxin-antitoxin system prevent-host-death family antitoxin [Spirochaetota bacterium]
MLIDTEKMIPITKLQRELTQQIRSVSSGKSPLYVLKNNEMEAVILSPDEYEYLSNLNEMVEQFEIDGMIQNRLTKYNRKKNIKWETLK